jgi:hypothetical protein
MVVEELPELPEESRMSTVPRPKRRAERSRHEDDETGDQRSA